MAEKSEKIRKMAKEMEISLAKIYNGLGIPEPVLAEKISAVTTIVEAKELFNSLPHVGGFPTRCKRDEVGGRALLEKLYKLYLQKFATVSTPAEARDIYRDEVKPRTSTSMGLGEDIGDIEKRAILARWCELVTTPEEAKELYFDTNPDYPEKQAIIRKIASMYDV